MIEELLLLLLLLPKKADAAARQATYLAKAATSLVRKEACSVRALKKL